MEKITQLIVKEAKIIVVSVIIGFVLTIGLTTKAYSDKVMDGISERFIRFHVLANSDSEADQQLKLKVRDGVLDALKDDIASCETLPETRYMLTRSFPKIQKTAEEIIAKEGYDYGIRVSLENIMFPTREYGDVVLPAGMYEALRVEIGGGNGKNWWCVVYPPLCYVDATQGTVSAKAKESLKENLTDNEYKFIVKNDDVKVKLKFKIVELWQEGKMIANAALRR